MMNLSIILMFLHLSFTSVFTEDSKLASVKSSAFGNDPEVMSEVRDPKKDAETVCKAFNAKPEETKLNLTGRMEYEDMLHLMTWNLKYDFKTGRNFVKIDQDLRRTREVFVIITDIFWKGCPSKFVPKGFAFIVRELFTIYLNSVEKFSGGTRKNWGHFIRLLEKCQFKLNEPITMGSKGYEAAYVVLKDDKGKEERVEVIPPQEAPDGIHTIDVIIDAIWWIFSFSFARCYPFMVDKSVDLAKYKRLFLNEFLSDLMLKRWNYGGRWTMDYAPIFGDIDLATTIKNARLCATAAYIANGMADRQLVRPLMTFSDSKMSSRKTE